MARPTPLLRIETESNVWPTDFFEKGPKSASRNVETTASFLTSWSTDTIELDFTLLLAFVENWPERDDWVTYFLQPTVQRVAETGQESVKAGLLRSFMRLYSLYPTKWLATQVTTLGRILATRISASYLVSWRYDNEPESPTSLMDVEPSVRNTTLLHMTLQSGLVELSRFLLLRMVQGGYHPEPTLLHSAAIGDIRELVAALIGRGHKDECTWPECVWKAGDRSYRDGAFCAADCAALAGHSECVELLGATDNDQLLFQCACVGGCGDVVLRLHQDQLASLPLPVCLPSGNIVPTMQSIAPHYPLEAAARANSAACAEYLLPLYPRIGPEAVIAAASACAFDALRDLPATGAALATCLRSGSVYGSELAAQSLDMLPVLPGKELECLVSACAGGVLPAVERLLSKELLNKVDSSSGETPLTAAAKQGQVLVLRQLLDAGADPDKPDASGCTALMLAVQAGIIKSARVLAPRSRISLVTRCGMSALHYAAAIPRIHSLALLIALSQTGDLNGTSGVGYTPLMHAIENGNLQAASLLLAAGADPLVRARKGTGDTAAHIAARAGNIDALQLLGPRAYQVPNGFGQRPADVARSAGKEYVEEFIKRSVA